MKIVQLESSEISAILECFAIAAHTLRYPSGGSCHPDLLVTLDSIKTKLTEETSEYAQIRDGLIEALAFVSDNETGARFVNVPPFADDDYDYNDEFMWPTF